MSKYLLVLSVLLVSLSYACSNIEVSSDFERGSIVFKENLGDSLLLLEPVHWLKRDSIGDQYYWFYFKLDNLPDDELTLRFENLEGIYRGGPHLMYKANPRFVYSYDQEEWKRLDAGLYDPDALSYSVSHTFEKGPVWIAWAHPYTYSQSLAFMENIKDHAYVSCSQISKSVEGRTLYLYEIANSGESSLEKETIVLMALQHPGEDAGGYFVEGFITELLKEAESEVLFEAYNFLILPVMNPDGLVGGTSRYNMNMADLNNIWNDPALSQPEVQGVKDWFHAYLRDGHTITHFFDVHCWGQEDNHLYLTNNDQGIYKLVKDYTPFSLWKSGSGGTADNYFSNQLGAGSSTVELSQKYNNSKLLTTEDYRNTGADFVRALRKNIEIKNASSL